MKKQIMLSIATIAVIGASTGVYASTSSTCTSIDKTTLETVLQKQQAGTTLTDDETALLATAKTCFAEHSESGSGKVDGGRGRKFGSGMTASGSEMPPRGEFGSGRTAPDGKSGSGRLAPKEDSTSGSTDTQVSKKKGYRAKITDSYANTVDTLVNKYTKAIDSKSQTEKLAAIDVFIAKIAAAETKIEASSSSDTLKAKYANVLGYLKQSFQEQRDIISEDTDGTDSSLLDSVLL